MCELIFFFFVVTKIRTVEREKENGERCTVEYGVQDGVKNLLFVRRGGLGEARATQQVVEISCNLTAVVCRNVRSSLADERTALILNCRNVYVRLWHGNGRRSERMHVDGNAS
jgi:hypothetical protein